MQGLTLYLCGVLSVFVVIFAEYWLYKIRLKRRIRKYIKDVKNSDVKNYKRNS